MFRQDAVPLGVRFTLSSHGKHIARMSSRTKEAGANSEAIEIRAKDNRRIIVLNARLFGGYPVSLDAYANIEGPDALLPYLNEMILRSGFGGSKSAAEVD